ncbi:NAD-specific glutamate dehydrogenase [Thalassocella blandensis]|nr:NAD-specific glutamate dehydrogenase [Thalassocella blandensis]
MEINAGHIEHFDQLINAIESFASQKYPSDEAEALVSFAKIYLSFFPLEEWVGREVCDLSNFLLGLQYFIHDDVASAARVQVFNPNLEEHGWLSGRTVITVLQRDMPFLVDSIRIELNRRDMPIQVVQSTVLNMLRKPNGELVSLTSNLAPGKAKDQEAAAGQGNTQAQEEALVESREALVYIETSLHDESEHASIRQSLLAVLNDITNVVNDYHAMLEQVESAAANLKQHRSHEKEAVEFLSWLKDSHFTFLGFREYKYSKKNEKQCLEEALDQRRGIFKKLEKTENVLQEEHFSQGMKRFYSSESVVFFSKSSTRSNVHRAVYPDYVVVKKFNAQGEVCGEVRFLGLFTYSVYSLSPKVIPLLRTKMDAIVKRTGLDPNGHYGKNLIRVIDNFPKEELFQSDTDTLFQNIWSVATINERHVVRLIVRKDPFGSFVNCMVYVPRDLYNTQVREKIQSLIGNALNSKEFDSTTFFSESTLARAQFVFRIDDDNRNQEIDVKALEEAIRDITRNWTEHLQTALIDEYGESKGLKYFNVYRDAFSPSYQEDYDARTAAKDIEILEKLDEGEDIAMNLFQPVGADDSQLRFKVLHHNTPLELSYVIPILENLGLRVMGEHPYKIKKLNGNVVWMHDFTLKFGLPVKVDVHAVRAHFEEAFAAVWRGKCENDAFNRLVLGARINWREVTVLRAYAGYLKQIAFNSAQRFIADTLVHHLEITRNLVAFFKANFDPRVNKYEDKEKNISRSDRLKTKIIESLDAVSNLNEDRVLRRYLDLMLGTLRTNFYQKNEHNQDRDYISIKFSPRNIPEMPAPRPMFEIYVYSPRVEGVHLRGGKVARGGLRWSDRNQDYRTEVLGLVKAQQVKNAVIVPNGAKGGFVAKMLDKSMGRDETQAEGIACYKIFIQGLLDITDNFVSGNVVKPDSVICKDEDDPYLVVAADKGTATFSDIANEISLRYGHWLGDAFASGGSQGYDHKGMGITAKGAWVSVQRHFREKGIDIQNEEFTVIGIGDMAGDVFGNGMLLSEKIRLCAAFNHMHIFIDPNPDAATSFPERKRLFDTPRTSWEDYNKELISAGGGVFLRSSKSISISAQMKERFSITADKLTPTELISALLKAPVDLIWNGGIGTYVKASWESHSKVGDKANDSLRVDGKDLRCRVFGEGGNLGMTQLGRVEYTLNSGACNTDFIDNAAGVDCSDHEVNIKILLDELVVNGDLTEKQRNAMLVDMTDEVAQLVLQNNYRQTLSISLAEHEVGSRINEYRRFISYLESQGKLDRALEYLPTDETIVERQGQGKALTRPELSVLISYSKVVLKEALISSEISNDPYIVKEIETAFPPKLRSKYPESIYQHRLKKEIVGTQVANDLINNLGITSAHRLLETTGASMPDVAKAYIVSRDVFQFEQFQQYVKQLDNKVPSEYQAELMVNIVRRVRRGTRWFLRNRRAGLNPEVDVKTFRDGILELQNIVDGLATGVVLDAWNKRKESMQSYAIEEQWVNALSMPDNLFSGLSVVEAILHVQAAHAAKNGGSLDQAQSQNIMREVAEVFFYLLDHLGLYWFATQLSDVHVESYWQALARESFIDDLSAQLRKLSVAMIRLKGDMPISEAYDIWAQKNAYLVNRWRNMVNEVQGSQVTDYAMFSVALRELIDLAQATEHAESWS